MNGIRSFLKDVNRELLIVLLLIGGLGVLNTVILQQRGFLNLYYLPIVVASYSLGRRKGVEAAILAVLLVAWLALIDPAAFATINPETTRLLASARPGLVSVTELEVLRWLDIVLWGGFLF